MRRPAPTDAEMLQAAAGALGREGHDAVGERRMTGVKFFTAATAFIAAVTGLVNTYQLGKLTGRMGALEKAHNTHVNMPGLHDRIMLPDPPAAAPPARHEQRHAG